MSQLLTHGTPKGSVLRKILSRHYQEKFRVRRQLRGAVSTHCIPWNFMAGSTPLFTVNISQWTLFFSLWSLTLEPH